jgi:hypothetical protein
MKEGGDRWRRAIDLLALGFAAGPQPTAFTMLSCSYGATPAIAQADAAHEKCLKVDCNTAEFDVESDGYRKQSIQGDASRQAPIIYSRLCNQKVK